MLLLIEEIFRQLFLSWFFSDLSQIGNLVLKHRFKTAVLAFQNLLYINENQSIIEINKLKMLIVPANQEYDKLFNILSLITINLIFKSSYKV